MTFAIGSIVPVIIHDDRHVIMTLDFAALDVFRTCHPAWRLLRPDHAVLVASFLYRVFGRPLCAGDGGGGLG
jgi:hypothetical protein